jgi:excisionase family DNA binding protein
MGEPTILFRMGLLCTTRQVRRRSAVFVHDLHSFGTNAALEWNALLKCRCQFSVPDRTQAGSLAEFVGPVACTHMPRGSDDPVIMHPTGELNPIGVRGAAQFLGISPSLVYAYVERKQIPHYRIGRCIRFSLPELALWRQQFHVNGGINE